MRRALTAVIAVAVLVACAALALHHQDTGPDTEEPEEYAITYELNGGTQNDGNPSSYTEGSTVALLNPTHETCYFDGWYLDEDLTERCDSITPDMSGDVTLYASWKQSMAGTALTFSLEGTVSDGPFNSYTLSGEWTYSYVYYDADGDRYYVETARTITYDFGMYGRTVSSESSFWTGESEVVWSWAETDTIETAFGTVECEVYEGTYNDGTVERQWIGSDGLVYRIDSLYRSGFSSTSLTYMLTEVSRFSPETEFDVIVYTDDGVSVTGEGTYTPGSEVTLTADVAGGGFGGWYDQDGNLLSESATYTFQAASDVTLFACNTVDDDMTWETDVTYRLVNEDGVDSTFAYVVESGSGETVAESLDSDPQHTFAEAGEYVVYIIGVREDGSAYHGFYGVLVDGTVTRTYAWESGGSTYEYKLEIAYSDVLRYRDHYTVDQRQQDVMGGHARDLTFVTYTDEYVMRIAADFTSMTASMADLERMDFLLAFTQYIEYQSDEVYMGAEEYWKFPLETLYDQGGDCEDTSILFAAVGKAMSYDTCLLLFTGHMAAGVAVDGCDGAGYYLRSDPSKVYYYCETTGTGYSVGERPSGIAGYGATLLAV